MSNTTNTTDNAVVKLLKSKAKLIFWGIGAIFVIGFLLSARFTPERFEVDLTARNQDMQNVWSMVEQGIKTGGYALGGSFTDTYLESIKAAALRYENDKSGMMKWVKESANQMSPDVHKKFMDTVEKAYARKERAQKNKISVAQAYDKYLRTSIKGAVSKYVYNYPSPEAKEIMDRIIMTKSTKQTWETGTEEAINPFAK